MGATEHVALESESREVSSLDTRRAPDAYTASCFDVFPRDASRSIRRHPSIPPPSLSQLNQIRSKLSVKSSRSPALVKTLEHAARINSPVLELSGEWRLGLLSAAIIRSAAAVD